MNLPAHFRVFAAFFLYSFSLGGFYPRLPEIQERLGVQEGALGLGLIGVASGTLVSLTFIAPKLERFGYRRVLLTLMPLVSIGMWAASLATQTWVMFMGLVATGLVVGCVETLVNVEADRVEHQLKRRIMNRAHGFWSFGFFSAGALSAMLARASWTPQEQLALSVALVLALMAILLSGYQAAPVRPTQSTDQDTPRWATPTRSIWLLVSVCASALLLEGAGFDWSAIYMRDAFGSDPAQAALAVSVVAFAQGITRFNADRFVQRFGVARVSTMLLTIMLAGNVLVVIATAPGWAMLGFAMLGVGSSAIFPLAVSAAAQRQDRPAAVNVSALAQNGFIIFLLAPPLLGFVAEHAGVRAAFAVCVPMVLISLYNRKALDPEADGETSSRK